MISLESPISMSPSTSPPVFLMKRSSTHFTFGTDWLSGLFGEETLSFSMVHPPMSIPPVIVNPPVLGLVVASLVISSSTHFLLTESVSAVGTQIEVHVSLPPSI